MITRIAAVQRELRSLDIPAVLITNLTVPQRAPVWHPLW